MVGSGTSGSVVGSQVVPNSWVVLVDLRTRLESASVNDSGEEFYAMNCLSIIGHCWI